jgi:pimeloyl-ACP methyl ester carboxylesterase
MSGLQTNRIVAWQNGGQLAPVDGRRIYVRRTDGDGPLLLFLHGFPSSSYDWRTVLPLVAQRATLALDFLDFGLSDKPRDTVYSLFTQADIVQQLVGEEPRPVLVIAHDMGTSVTTELLARDLNGSLKFKLAGVLVLNGGMIVERASLTWAQQALRSPLGPILAQLSNRPVFVSQFSRLFSDTHPLSPADWPGVLQFAWGRRSGRDPNVLAGLRELRPAAPVRKLTMLGHDPQIEMPDQVAADIDELVRAVATGADRRVGGDAR